MYSHLAKGFTLGERLTRRLLRNIIGFPGLILDVCIIAPLFTPSSGKYTDFWEINSVQYLDGSKVSGWAQIGLGYLGDLIGAAIGGVGGAILGSVLYIPDGILRIIAWGHDLIQYHLDAYAQLVGNNKQIFSKLSISDPSSYLGKAWNISIGTLGVLIAAAPYVAAKLIEFFIPPLGNNLSTFVWEASCFIGGVIGGAVAFPFFFAKEICNRLVDLYRQFRDSVRSLTAMVYAVTEVELYKQTDDCCCVPPAVVHSKEFLDKVDHYKNQSLHEIVFNGSTAELMKAMPVNVDKVDQPAPQPSAPREPNNYQPPQVSVVSQAPSVYVPNNKCG